MQHKQFVKTKLAVIKKNQYLNSIFYSWASWKCSRSSKFTQLLKTQWREVIRGFSTSSWITKINKNIKGTTALTLLCITFSFHYHLGCAYSRCCKWQAWVGGFLEVNVCHVLGQKKGWKIITVKDFKPQTKKS